MKNIREVPLSAIYNFLKNKGFTSREDGLMFTTGRIGEKRRSIYILYANCDGSISGWGNVMVQKGNSNDYGIMDNFAPLRRITPSDVEQYNLSYLCMQGYDEDFERAFKEI